MGIEKILSKTKNIGRRFLVGIALTSALSFNGCQQKVDITTPDDITVDPKHVGMIEGRAFSASISTKNQIVFSGYEGAEIRVLKPNYEYTDFKTTSISEGVYAIDNIPTGSYNIMGCGPGTGWVGDPPCDYEPAVVSSQQSYKVSDLVVTIDKADKDAIFYGTLFENNQPSVGRKLELWLNDIEKRGETTTSSTGDFAFYIDITNGSHYLRSPGGAIKIDGWPSNGFINFANVKDEEFEGPLFRKNATFTPN